MEDTNQPLDADLGSRPSGQNLRFTEPVRSDLLETSKWAMFFAVLIFIALGFVLIGSLFIMAAGSGGAIVGILMAIIYGGLMFFPGWYYYKFSTSTRQALEHDNNMSLEEGFANLKRFYRFIGILIIVVIGLYVLFAVAGIAFLSSGNFPGTD